MKIDIQKDIKTTIVLDEDESAMLAAICGSIYGGGEMRKLADSIYEQISYVCDDKTNQYVKFIAQNMRIT